MGLLRLVFVGSGTNGLIFQSVQRGRSNMAAISLEGHLAGAWVHDDHAQVGERRSEAVEMGMCE